MPTALDMPHDTGSRGEIGSAGSGGVSIAHRPMVTSGNLDQMGRVCVDGGEDVRAGHQPPVVLCPVLVVYADKRLWCGHQLIE